MTTAILRHPATLLNEEERKQRAFMLASIIYEAVTEEPFVE